MYVGLLVCKPAVTLIDNLVKLFLLKVSGSFIDVQAYKGWLKTYVSYEYPTWHNLLCSTTFSVSL